MPWFDKDEQKKPVVILQPATLDDIVSRQSRGFPVVRYAVSMFRIDNSNIRTRRISKSPWNDSFTARISDRNFSIFSTRDAGHKVEVPIRVENSSGVSGHKNTMKTFYQNLEQYFSNSTLHGLRYVGDTSISFGERLFWLCSFFGAVGFAAYFISSIYEKYDHNPIIVSLNPKLTAVYSLPFPAITICNMNQVKRSEADKIIQEGTEVEKILLDDYCNDNTTFAVGSVSDEAAKWDNVQKFIIRVNPSCQDIVKVCLWKQEERNCLDLFNAALTDEGLCCTFNTLPRKLIFRNPREMSDLNITYPDLVDDWTPEGGYSKNVTPNTLPFRAPGAGTHLGLTIVADADVKSYYCSSTSSVGFKILLHNPIETPKMTDYAFMIPPGVESRISIYPKISDASPSIKNIDVKKRMCFFTSERNLLFYRTYTERNCKLECEANYTLLQCGCVPYYLPKSKNKKICGKKQEVCIRNAKLAMETSFKNSSSCNCLPGCFELDFESRATYGKLMNAFELKDNIIKNESMEYFVNNMAIMHFYFIESQFTRSTKSELYGFSEFLSNTGGLLGLFLGFSFLSAVEIGYYLTLRVLCKFLRTRNKTDTKNPALIYPFAK